MTKANTRRWASARSAPWVVGSGATNALGFNAEQTWAFWRAETTPWTEGPFHAANGVKAPMAIDRTLPTRCFGAERMWVMLRRCLDELSVLASLQSRRGALMLGVAERLSSRPFTAQRARLESVLGGWLAAYLPSATARLLPLGHASLAPALLQAGQLLDERLVDFAIVGAVDTYYDPATIQLLNRQRRLFDTIEFDTLLAGEGAALLVLCLPSVAEQVGLTGHSALEMVAEAEEPATMFSDLPCAASGLSQAMRAVTQAMKADQRQLEWVLGDCTNEVYRTHEFGLAFPRAIAPGGLDTAGRDFFPIAADDLEFDFLPECFGDLGAATMATGAVVASESMRRGHPSTSHCMIISSSEGPTRGAALISRTSEGGR